MIGVFALLNWLSPPFEYGSQQVRPYLIVTVLLLISSVVALVGLHFSLQTAQRQRKSLLLLIVGVAISVRLIAIFTCPILEIDYYRYLWDGKVAVEGISPYRYAPAEVLEVKIDGDPSLARLNKLAVRTESNHTVLSRIHYADYTTIYPPVSQFVFAATMRCLPESATVEAHIVAIKFTLVLFDLATLGLVCFLLRAFHRRIGWLIVYAWNPLVIKEIANGGHLDSIATFWTIAALVMLAGWHLSKSHGSGRNFLLASATALGLGVGAKLFPLVLMPAVAIYVSRKSVRQAAIFVLVFGVATSICLSPMVYSVAANTAATEGSGSPLQNQATPKPKDGAAGFFTHWRMNDTAFACVYFNLRDSDRAPSKDPWFVVTSRDFRKRFHAWCRDHSIGGSRPAFFVAKALTLLAFSAFYLWQLFLIRRNRFGSPERETDGFVDLLRRLAVSLTVFLFLQPTVNPWYLVWVAPLACFSDNRGWLLVSGLLLTYYIRFWFKSLQGSFWVLGQETSGTGIYDHFIVWIVMTCILGTFAFSVVRKLYENPVRKKQ